MKKQAIYFEILLHDGGFLLVSYMCYYFLFRRDIFGT